MFRLPVRSSNLASVGYDPQTRILEIEFRNGAIYQYRGVPSAVFLTLMYSPSPGRYFNAAIREAGYPFYRVH